MLSNPGIDQSNLPRWKRIVFYTARHYVSPTISYNGSDFSGGQTNSRLETNG